VTARLKKLSAIRADEIHQPALLTSFFQIITTISDGLMTGAEYLGPARL
jgi:hypothetical protein